MSRGERLTPRIEPEPDDAERRAILLALERAAAPSEPALDPYRSAWREAGIRESLDASEGG